MGSRRRYRKRADRAVTAVQLDLDTQGLVYRKWGTEQRGKPGDWVVDNDGDIYTVDRESFARTYRQISPGRFVKTTSVWAEVASDRGMVETKEGQSFYEAGDYLVSNGADETDAYPITRAKFEAMYELDPEGRTDS